MPKNLITEINIRYILENKKCILPEIYERIKDDKELWYSYQANIAIAFSDALYNYKKKHKKQYLNQKDIHEISNNAANYFLGLWTGVSSILKS
jgi:hypothetical protein